MSEKVKIAMIAGVVVLVAVWMILKNTPYNRCVDAIIDGTEQTNPTQKFGAPKTAEPSFAATPMQHGGYFPLISNGIAGL